MPFIRYLRDKRGYETTYVMHGYRPGQAGHSTRVLYLFRSPAHVKVGRKALDEEAREALTHTHPDLTFDWATLGQGAPEARHGHDSPGGHDGPDRPQRHRRPAAPHQGPPAPPPRPMAADDQSLLGRTLGAAEAARLRSGYGELLGRIARRARTPEERDRLSERAQRLNPDEWPDETAVRSGKQSLDADWNALIAELPQRRRGRRGGRRQDGDRRPAGPSASPGAQGLEADSAELQANPDVSGILEESGDANAHIDKDVRAGDEPGAPGDRDPVGAEARPDPAVPATRATDKAAGDEDRPDAGLPRDD